MRNGALGLPRKGMTPFSLWIRTGNWLPAQVDDLALEVKFNPNHDPKDGKFTSGPGGGGQQRRSGEVQHSRSGDGTWNGGGFTGGGRGSFGGAGASGDGYWMNSAEVRAFRARHPGLDPHMVSPGETLDLIAASRHVTSIRLRQLNGLSPGAALKPGQILALPKTGSSAGGGELRRTEMSGYAFGIDAKDRTHEAKGELYLATDQIRSKTNQSRAGGADRRTTDDGGHFVAVRFGGPSDSFNHFAQDANFNRGAYRAIEDRWAKDLRAGRHVSVDILARYPGTSRRPDKLIVKWSVNGRPQRQSFVNAPGGK